MLKTQTTAVPRSTTMTRAYRSSLGIALSTKARTMVPMPTTVVV